MDETYDDQSIGISNIYGRLNLRRKTRTKRQKALIREMFYDYATNTTLHGLPYTTRRGLTMIEKIFWVITFIASICLCSYLIRNVYIKWRTSPVIVTVSEKLVPVSTVPFPSVLICPQSKVNAAVYNYTDEKIRIDNFIKHNYPNISLFEEDIAKFEDVSHVCGPYGMSSRSLTILPRFHSDETVAKHIYDVALKREDVFDYCGLPSGEIDDACESIVSETLTREGLCFSINSLAVQDIFRNNSMHNNITYMTADKPAVHWTKEHGYSSYNYDTYPVPGKEYGTFPDLEIVLREEMPQRDPLCNAVNSGYKVYIQHPADLPQSTLYSFAVHYQMVSSMALSFSILNTTEALRGYDAGIRQCYFPDERYLKYFKIYTANNCKIECLANITFEMCNCVAFYMPHESGKICTYRSRRCMNNARDYMVGVQEFKENSTCHCLPSCESINYGAELLQTYFKLADMVTTFYKTVSKHAVKEPRTHQFSKLEFYFKQSQFMSMRRSEIFGVTDFLANIGGLLGLFLGFSFLSLVELFYFLTLRLWCTLKRDLKEENTQTKHTLDNRF